MLLRVDDLTDPEDATTCGLHITPEVSLFLTITTTVIDRQRLPTYTFCVTIPIDTLTPAWQKY